MPMRQVSENTGLSYNTVHRAIRLIQFAIISHSRDAKDFFDCEIGFGKDFFIGEIRGKKIRNTSIENIVLNIDEQTDKVRIFIEPYARAEIISRLSSAKRKVGNVVYTNVIPFWEDKKGLFDTQIFYASKRLRIENTVGFEIGNIHIDSINGFWRWAKNRIKKRKFSKKTFPFYMKELELRYNHRNEDIFDLISCHICELMPTNE